MSNQTWQDMDTAPQNGERILIRNLIMRGVEVVIGYYSGDGQWLMEPGDIIISNYTHWMPLPDTEIDDSPIGAGSGEHDWPH